MSLQERHEVCCALPLFSGQHICYEQGFTSSANAGQSKCCNLISQSNESLNFYTQFELVKASRN